MLNDIIRTKKNQWLQSPNCTITGLIRHIKRVNKLRTPQIEAIETYLFLKIAGENKPLWQLFSEGFFNEPQNTIALNLKSNALALYQFAKRQKLAKLADLILEKPDLDFDAIIKSLFYNVSYPDYLLSLPMGAGKTYLMAAFMYLDLYFAELEPDNKYFAHNFLVLIPSGLKSSIVPSLRTIQHFEPSWVLPEPSASKLKNLLKFDVLDESKSAKKSNKANNPNAQKVNNVLPNPFGQVFVVNAEKVILNRVDLQPLLPFIEKNKEDENELRHLIGEIPNLSILIDEVHHAATDDIKLRQVVNAWHAGGNITTVLGFSGTPYLQKADKIELLNNEILKLTEISNTVYYYPLIEAVKTFLKKPKVQTGKNLNRFEILKHGVEEFNELYRNKIYANGSIPKLAIYCTSIEDLYENVLPFLTSELAVNRDEILEFHGGNKNYPIAKENALAFRSLDFPHSKHRYILLVQIGKEGWDCRSLTGVILSQKGDSPQNMILQTACRCLRQVDLEQHETALIWLNQDNAETLNKQLQQEQHITIADLNAAKTEFTNKIERVSRTEYLQLPPLEFHQLKVTYQATDIEEDANTKEKLNALLADIDDYKRIASTITSTIENVGEGSTNFISEEGEHVASYKKWLFELVRSSFKTINLEQLNAFDTDIYQVFERVTYQKNGQLFFNDLYDLPRIESQIRLSFARQRELQTETEIIPQTAQLLLVEKLTPVNESAKIYPNKDEVTKILEFDANNKPLEMDLAEKQRGYDVMKQSMEAQGLAHFMPTFEAFQTGFEISDVVKRKNQTFHYLPYDFGASGASGFEFDLFKKALSDSDFQNQANALEIYYNGERGLTEFVIDCFAKNGKYWKNIGHYTPDFLMIRRNDANEIHKVLIIETKGNVYANDFKPKKTFMEAEFLRVNNEKYGYARFDFLYLEDSQSLDLNAAKLNARIKQFFNNTTE